MKNGSRKQITFDLHQESLRQHYPRRDTSQNQQFYKKAYDDIRRFMCANGFEHRQYSVYTSNDRMTTLDVVGLMERLAEQFPWLHHCVNEIDVTNIGVQHSLKQTLSDAAKGLEMDLGEPTLSNLPIDVHIETSMHQTKQRKKRKNTPER